MKRDDLMLLSLTFLTGLAIGMYIYIGVFRPTYTPDTISGAEEQASEWSLVARRYGGSSAGQAEPTFRLLGDRSYTYLPGGEPGSDLEPREGKISRALMRNLRNYDQSLVRYAGVAETDDCPSYYNGYDHEYRFFINNASFDLDTCYTALGSDTDLALLLEDVWDEVEGFGMTSGGGGGFSSWAEGWIRDNLGVNQDK